MAFESTVATVKSNPGGMGRVTGEAWRVLKPFGWLEARLWCEAVSRWSATGGLGGLC